MKRMIAGLPRLSLGLARYKSIRASPRMKNSQGVRGSKLKNKKLDSQFSSNSNTNSRPLFKFGKFSSLSEPKSAHRSESLLEKVSTFEELRIFPTVRAAMTKEIKQGYTLKNTYVNSKEDLVLKPSPVQIAAIKKINQARGQKPKLSVSGKGGQDIVNELIAENEHNKLKVFTIAAETGSGKTWAYLAPILSKLKEEELELFQKSKELYENAKTAQIIRSVILLPTHELVEQVYKTVIGAAKVKYDLVNDVGQKYLDNKQYSEFISLPENKENLGLNVVKWGAGDSHVQLFQKLERNGRIDVLITTPSKIEGLSKLTNVSRPFKNFRNVSYAVVDEADTLMDKSWIVDTTSVLQRFNNCKDVIFCSATIPTEFSKTMNKMFKDDKSIIKIVTPSLHKIPKQIVVKVIDANASPYHGSKSRCLAQALYAIHNDGTEPEHVKRILVFVNEKKDVEPLVETLINKYKHREEDIIGVTGKDSPEDRLMKIEPFLKPADLVEDDLYHSKIKVLVTTDLLARGMNFDGIKNVILMDLPNTSVDLVHRIGRTGRMRQSGRVFVIVDKKTKKTWIKGLPNVVRRGVAIG